jgi:hypothetical protein
MNVERLQTFSDRRPPTGAEVNNELQMIVEAFNDHNQGRKGWDRLEVKDGANKRMGTATLVGGTVTVSNTTVTASTRIFTSRQALGGTAGHLSIGTVVAGTSFIINSSSGTDTSVVAWLLIEPK